VDLDVHKIQKKWNNEFRMKFIDIDKMKYQYDPKKALLFILFAFIFAFIASFRKFNNIINVIEIILLSVLITAIILLLYFKFDAYFKIEAKFKKMSFVTIFVLAYILPKIIFKNIKSDFIEYLILWICVEGLAFGFFLKPYLLEKRKKRQRDVVS